MALKETNFHANWSPQAQTDPWTLSHADFQAHIPERNSFRRTFGRVSSSFLRASQCGETYWRCRPSPGWVTLSIRADVIPAMTHDSAATTRSSRYQAID